MGIEEEHLAYCTKDFKRMFGIVSFSVDLVLRVFDVWSISLLRCSQVSSICIRIGPQLRITDKTQHSIPLQWCICNYHTNPPSLPKEKKKQTFLRGFWDITELGKNLGQVSVPSMAALSTMKMIKIAKIYQILIKVTKSLYTWLKDFSEWLDWYWVHT